MNDALQRNIYCDQYQNPAEDAERADSVGQAGIGDRGRQFADDLVDAAGLHDAGHRSGDDADVNQQNVEDVGQAGRPHAADERDADENDCAGEHAAGHAEDIRQQGM